jgi:hypothetical protein
VPQNSAMRATLLSAAACRKFLTACSADGAGPVVLVPGPLPPPQAANTSGAATTMKRGFTGCSRGNGWTANITGGGLPSNDWRRA